MKKTSPVFYLAFLLMFIIITVTKAQPYQPIPDSNAIWIIQETYWDDYLWRKFLLSETPNDTMINNNLYTKIYAGSDINEENYYGAFRNDTDGISYYLPKYTLEEYILRDFTKNNGDIVENVAYEYDWDTWVLDFYVDSLEYVISGPYTYKVMYLSTVIEDTIPEVPPHEPLVWMEKIGSYGGGILNSHGGALGSKRLYCMQYNDTIYYDSFLWWFRTEDIVYEAGECPYPVGINEPGSDGRKVQVIPNPFYKQITLSNLPVGKTMKITLCNLKGQIIFSKNLRANQSVELIDINPELSKGLYILKIQSEDQILTTKKIVKQ